MKIVLALVADCDPPPHGMSAQSLDAALDALCSKLEDELAELLVDLGAGFEIATTRKVEV